MSSAGTIGNTYIWVSFTSVFCDPVSHSLQDQSAMMLLKQSQRCHNRTNCMFHFLFTSQSDKWHPHILRRFSSSSATCRCSHGSTSTALPLIKPPEPSSGARSLRTSINRQAIFKPERAVTQAVLFAVPSCSKALPSTSPTSPLSFNQQLRSKHQAPEDSILTQP